MIEHTQHEAQPEVAELGTGTKWSSDTRSGHGIVLDNPALVSRFANQVVLTLRQRELNGSLETEGHDRITQGT